MIAQILIYIALTNLQPVSNSQNNKKEVQNNLERSDKIETQISNFITEDKHLMTSPTCKSFISNKGYVVYSLVENRWLKPTDYSFSEFEINEIDDYFSTKRSNEIFFISYFDISDRQRHSESFVYDAKSKELTNGASFGRFKINTDTTQKEIYNEEIKVKIFLIKNTEVDTSL